MSKGFSNPDMKIVVTVCQCKEKKCTIFTGAMTRGEIKNRIKEYEEMGIEPHLHYGIFKKAGNKQFTRVLYLSYYNPSICEKEK